MKRGPSARSGRTGGRKGPVATPDIEVVESPAHCGRIVGREQTYRTSDGMRRWRCCEGPHSRWEVFSGREGG